MLKSGNRFTNHFFPKSSARMMIYPQTEIKNSHDLILTPLQPIFLAQINGIQHTHIC